MHFIKDRNQVFRASELQRLSSQHLLDFPYQTCLLNLSTSFLTSWWLGPGNASSTLCWLKSRTKLILGWSRWLYLSQPSWKSSRLAILVLDIHLMSFSMNTNQSFLDHLAALIGPLPSKGWFSSAWYLSYTFVDSQFFKIRTSSNHLWFNELLLRLWRIYGRRKQNRGH